MIVSMLIVDSIVDDPLPLVLSILGVLDTLVLLEDDSVLWLGLERVALVLLVVLAVARELYYALLAGGLDHVAAA